MTTAAHIAKHFKDVHFGGNWTAVNLKETLENVTWEQATTNILSFNTIATLVFHTNYFVVALLDVLKGNPLDAHDKFSFAHPPFESQQDWENFLAKVFADAESCATLIERLPESKLWEDFSNSKYGNYYRNIHGITEHLHYHLGQIVLIKKMLLENEKPTLPIPDSKA